MKQKLKNNFLLNLIICLALLFSLINTGCKRDKYVRRDPVKKDTDSLYTRKADKFTFHKDENKTVKKVEKKSTVTKKKIQKTPDTNFNSNGAVYTIQPGDSLWKISRMFHIPINYLVEYNDLYVDAPLKVGQELIIPNSLNQKPPRRKKTSDKNNISVKKIKPKKTSYKSSKFDWPLKGDVLRRFSSNFKGIEISSSKSSFVKAIDDGEVIFADNMDGYGKLVIVDHLKDMFSIYGQLRTILVNNGDSIKKGQKVGRGGTANSSSQNRVYFEIRKAKTPGTDPTPVNPLRYLK